MFNLQFSEVIIILVVALILLGPKRLPDIARTVAKGLKEVRRASSDLRETWENEVEQTAGPELRALKKLRDPGALVDAAWESPDRSQKAKNEAGDGKSEPEAASEPEATADATADAPADPGEKSDK